MARASDPIDQARAAALAVLRHNRAGPCRGLFRTAGWGYPEPYTRDMMISGLGILASGDEALIEALRRVLVALADNQSPLGHMPSLAHDPDDRGASDTTPLFLLLVPLFRRVTGEADFLADAAERALSWMAYQSPDDRVLVAQLPTSDWRDEQWVLGYGLFVNAVVHGYLRLWGRHDSADQLRKLMGRFTITEGVRHRHVHEGLAVKSKPYYALCAYKIYSSERFDLLGNSLAILLGVAAPSRAKTILAWLDDECDALRARGELAVDLAPNFFPYIQPGEPDWRDRYGQFNRPGEYHNGGVWPFVCGFHIAAAVAAGRQRLARRLLEALTRLVRGAREQPVEWGFNEWHRAQDGRPAGQDWQTWSAAMYLYAAACVDAGRPVLLEDLQPS